MPNKLVKGLNLSDSQSFILLFPMLPPNILSESSLTTTFNINNPFFLQIFDTVLPSMNFSIDDTPHMMKHREIVGRITYDTWNTSFLVDEQWLNYKIMFNWLQFIDSNISTQTRHSKNEYKIDATLEILNTQKDKVISFNFVNLSPTILGEVAFTYQESNYLTCNVSFEYDYIKLVQ